jgi:two-component system nitrogen regulation response regulator NtrX
LQNRLIVYENDRLFAKGINKELKSPEREICYVESFNDFMLKLDVFFPDVIIFNINSNDIDYKYSEVLTKLQNENISNAKVICFYSDVKSATISEVFQKGVFQIIEKNSVFCLRQLKIFVENAIHIKKQEEENLNLQIENINLKKNLIHSYPFIGESKSVIETKKRILKLAEADEDMFVLGETGTGKEVAAYFYYLNSSRFAKTFQTVNCSALTETLIESELFGHVKGSFTSADRNKVGFFERCNNGLLFLDEVTNLSLPAQSKILRAIENKEVQVVGGDLKKVDTKLIFASNANMEKLSQQDVFRKDLFYRIEGNIIELKPLRERGDDILLLMSFFISSFSQNLLTTAEYDLMELKDLLLSYSWPGNIRELKNFCKFLLLSVPKVDNRAIKKQLETKISQDKEIYDNKINKYLHEESLKKSLSLYEKDFLMYHLLKNKWQISHTAKSIGIERTTLYKKMKSYNMTNKTQKS